MAKMSVTFNQRFFESILKSAGVRDLTREKAEQARELAYQSAPVDTGDYREGLAVEEHPSRHRTVFRVVGHDKKTLIIESKTGNLARAVKGLGRRS